MGMSMRRPLPPPARAGSLRVLGQRIRRAGRRPAARRDETEDVLVEPLLRHVGRHRPYPPRALSINIAIGAVATSKGQYEPVFFAASDFVKSYTNSVDFHARVGDAPAEQ